MSVIRLLNNGSWSKPPVLTAARKILIDGLASNWQKTELGDLATFVNGTSYDRGQLADSGIPIIRISNMTDPRSEYLTTNQPFDNKYTVQTNDLLVSWSASFKSVIWSGPTGVLNQHIFKVTEKPGNHRGFIRHAIEAVFDDMQSKVVGIGMMHLRRRDFLGYQVPAPDYRTQEAICRFLDWLDTPNNQPEPTLPSQLSEQRRIVARIGELTARIEEARGLRRQAVGETNALLTSCITQVLDNTPVDGCLRDVLAAKPRNGWSVRCDNPEDGIPVLSLGAVTGFHYRATEYKKTSESTVADAHYWLRQGDLLITRSNTPELVGHAAIYNGSPDPCIYPDLMMRLVVDENHADKRFVHYWLMSFSARDHVQRNAKGTSPSMKKISQGTVMGMPFPSRLSIKEQHRIVAYLDDLQAKIDSLKRLQAETAAELDALLPSVLDRAFKGKL
jgi:restriction endonuclease S subunit